MWERRGDTRLASLFVLHAGLSADAAEAAERRTSLKCFFILTTFLAWFNWENMAHVLK